MADYRSDPAFSHVQILGDSNEIHADPGDIGEGAVIANYCFIGAGVRIGTGTRIGNFTEINSGAVIGAHNLINSHCHINSDTVMGHKNILGSGVLTADEKYMTSRTGNVKKSPCSIGNDCRIGQGASIVCCKLHDHVSIGAGAVVLEPEIPDCQVWAGIPARFLRMMSKKEMSI